MKNGSRLRPADYVAAGKRTILSSFWIVVYTLFWFCFFVCSFPGVDGQVQVQFPPEGFDPAFCPVLLNAILAHYSRITRICSGKPAAFRLEYGS